MSRISNLTKYPYDYNITEKDFVIGTNGDNNNKKTKNFPVVALAEYVRNFNNNLSYDRVISIGEITSENNNITINVNDLGNVVYINHTFYTKNTSDTFTFTPVTEGVKIILLYALPDEQIFYMLEGVQSIEAVEPTLPSGALFVQRIIVTVDGIEIIPNDIIISDNKVQITEDTPFANIGQSQKDFNKNVSDYKTASDLKNQEQDDRLTDIESENATQYDLINDLSSELDYERVRNDAQDSRLENLEGINYVWSPTNRTLTLFDNNGTQLSQVSLVSLDNEGTDLRYNASTLSLELYNADNELLDSIPVSSFVGSVGTQLQLNSNQLQLKDSQGNILSTVTFEVSNISGLQATLDVKLDKGTYNGTAQDLKSLIDTKINGSGTENYVSKFTASGTVGNSIVYDNGINVGIGSLLPSEKLDVNGYTKAFGFKVAGGTATQSLTANGGTFDLNIKADLVDGKVPSSQLPSYVDDVLEFANFVSFPATGENGKIYVALDTNLTYRWSGSTYAEISPSLTLGETSTTAYRGDRGKIAYDHSQITSGNPHGTTLDMVTDAGNSTDNIINVRGVSSDYYDVNLDTSPYVYPLEAGRILWNSTDGTYDMCLYNDVTLQAGQEQHFYGKAVGTIANGSPVQFVGSQGSHFLIKSAVASEINANPELFMGIATQDFTNNQFGYVTIFGNVRDLNTSAYTDGTLLYFDSVNGGLTSTKPSYPNARILVCAVINSHATQGSLFVRPEIQRYGKWNEIVNQPSTFPPSAHIHTISDVTNLQTSLDSKVDKVTGKGLSTEDYTTAEKTKLAGIQSGAEVNVNADWNATSGDAHILNKPSTFTPSAHTHPISQVDNLQTTLDAKADLVNGKVPQSQSQGSNLSLDYTTNTLSLTDASGAEKNVYLNKYEEVLIKTDSPTFDPSTDPLIGKFWFNITNGKVYSKQGLIWQGQYQLITTSEKTNYDTAYTHSQTNGNPHNTTKLDIGLSNVDNTSDANKPISNATQSALNAKADLVNGVIPSSQLPSFVDDVLEFANLASFPATGESGKIYVALNTNLTYRWSGTTYAEISPSLALGETSSTAYRGDRGKIAYDHSQVTHDKTLVGLGNVDNTSDLNKPISTATQTALNSKLDKGGYVGTAQNLKNDIDNIQIGGRNLIKGSNRLQKTDLDVQFGVQMSGTDFLLRNNPNLSRVPAIGSTILYYNLIAGDTYTISAYVKKEDGANNPRLWIYDGSQQDIEKEIPFNIWTKITHTWVHSKGGTTEISIYALNSNLDNSNGLRIKEIQVEKGNKATDWTPAPEDKQDNLQDITGNIGVGKTDASATEKLDVNGYVKATGFKTPSGTSTQFLMADGSSDGNSRTFNWENAYAVGFSSGEIPNNSGSQYPYIYHNAGGYVALATQNYVINNYAPKNTPIFNNKIVIRDNAIEDIGTNGTSSIAINYAGYNSGYTHYRNLAIYDGKGGNVAIFDGQNKSLNLTGNLTANSLIKSGGTSTQFLMADGSVNSNTYAKTDGTNASGTWGINISGNASTASSTTVVGVHSSNEVNLGGGYTGGGTLYVNYNDGGSYTNMSFYNGGTSLCQLTASQFNGALSGNATTATTLQTARAINGTSFNGSANITTANWGTGRTITIGSTGKTVDGSGNVSWTLAEIGAQAALTNPITGTATSGQVAFFNGTTTQTGDTNLFWDNTNKRLGIGTSSPSERLTVATSEFPAASFYRDLDALVVGDVGQRILIGAKKGSVFTPAASIMGVLESSGDNGHINFETFAGGGLQTRMRITSAGNVGIGTTNPNAGGILQVTSRSGSVENSYFTTNDFALGATGSAFNIQFGASSGNTYTRLRALNSGASNWANLVMQDGGGNVGIGTTSPLFKLDVNGTSRIAGTVHFLGSLRNYSGEMILNQAVNSNMLFYTNAAEKMRITNTGNVGIGTTSPVYKFHVNDTSDGIVGHFSGGLNNYTLISFKSNESNVYSTSLGSYNSGMLFRTGATDRMYITSGGNVGIGTTTPSTMLDVNGWATFLYSSGNRLKIWDGTDDIPTISADNLLVLDSPTIQLDANDVTDSSNTSIYLKLKTINGNTTLDNSYHNKIVRITASCTITIPNNLRTDFNCTFEVIGAYTAQFVDGSGATTSAPFGRYLKTDLTAMFYCTGTASNYRLNGSLTTS